MSKIRYAVARHQQTCTLCTGVIEVGYDIKTHSRAWVHLDCSDPTRKRAASPKRPWMQHIKHSGPSGAPPSKAASRARPEERAHSVVGSVSLSGEWERDLEVARALAVAGVPLFVAPPNLGKYASPKRPFIEPERWQRSVADPAVVGRWEPGMLLAAVTGVVLDVVDTDPRNGGTPSRESIAEVMPRAVAVAATPRGGTHEFIPCLGVAKRSGSNELLSGLDLLAGAPDGTGRGYVRLAPTVTPHGTYSWTARPDFGSPLDVDGAARLARALDLVS